MKQVGFLGCGKIGKTMIRHLKVRADHPIAFVQTPNFKGDIDLDCPVVSTFDEDVCKADLVVECATPDVLKQQYQYYLRRSDMLILSLTAFSDDDFANKAYALCEKHGTNIYLAHGAILGLDGIFDARDILNNVTIETVKNPKSLGRSDTDRTVFFNGSTREACQLMPRNVNVHAAIAMAGLGFDKTHSKIISDPNVSTNSHIIKLEGEGFSSTIDVSSFATGGITGKYTPISACGSLDRILGGKIPYQFV